MLNVILRGRKCKQCGYRGHCKKSGYRGHLKKDCKPKTAEANKETWDSAKRHLREPVVEDTNNEEIKAVEETEKEAIEVEEMNKDKETGSPKAKKKVKEERKRSQ